MRQPEKKSGIKRKKAESPTLPDEGLQNYIASDEINRLIATAFSTPEPESSLRDNDKVAALQSTLSEVDFLKRPLDLRVNDLFCTILSIFKVNFILKIKSPDGNTTDYYGGSMDIETEDNGSISPELAEALETEDPLNGISVASYTVELNLSEGIIRLLANPDNYKVLEIDIDALDKKTATNLQLLNTYLLNLLNDSIIEYFHILLMEAEEEITELENDSQIAEPLDEEFFLGTLDISDSNAPGSSSDTTNLDKPKSSNDDPFGNFINGLNF